MRLRGAHGALILKSADNSMCSWQPRLAPTSSWEAGSRIILGIIFAINRDNKDRLKGESVKRQPPAARSQEPQLDVATGKSKRKDDRKKGCARLIVAVLTWEDARRHQCVRC